MSYIKVNAQMWTKILLRSGSISTLQMTLHRFSVLSFEKKEERAH